MTFDSHEPSMDADRATLMHSWISAVHETDPDAYHKAAKRTNTFFKHNYLRHIPKDKDARILEIGPGFGEFLYFCRDAGYTNARGLDLSEESVNFCTKIALDVTLGDVFEFLTDPSRSFDAIVMNDTIEHIPKHRVRPLLRMIYDRLESGGVLIIKTPNMSNPLLGSQNRYVDFTHEFGWTEASARTVLRHEGFNPVAILPSNLYVFYSNPLNYIGLVLSKTFELFFWCYYALNGHTATRVFTKNLLAVAYKP